MAPFSKLRRIRQQGEGSEESVNRDFKSEVKTTVQTCDNDTSSNAYAATAESNNLHV